MSDDTGNHNAPAPNNVQSAGQWWGETMTKVFVTVIGAISVGMGAWMLTIYTELISIDARLEGMAITLEETRQNTSDAQTAARSNARRIDYIENTRFTDRDFEKQIAPLERRVADIEAKIDEKRRR